MKSQLVSRIPPTNLSISPRSDPISTLMMSSAYCSSMFSLIWLFSSMENILSHLESSGEPQGAALAVAAEVEMDKRRCLLRFWFCSVVFLSFLRVTGWQ